jgi:hypothetical protein
MTVLPVDLLRSARCRTVLPTATAMLTPEAAS